MKAKFSYCVNVEVQLTQHELLHLITLSKMHYDCTCIEASMQGGFLYGWANYMNCVGGSASYCLTSRQVDTICKILEAPEANRALVVGFSNLLKSIHAEAHAVREFSNFRNGSICTSTPFEMSKDL